MIICSKCGGPMRIDTPALAFLHDQLHSKRFTSDLTEAFGLGALPYVLFERIGRLMEDYHAAKIAGLLASAKEILDVFRKFAGHADEAEGSMLWRLAAAVANAGE